MVGKMSVGAIISVFCSNSCCFNLSQCNVYGRTCTVYGKTCMEQIFQFFSPIAVALTSVTVACTIHIKLQRIA